MELRSIGKITIKKAPRSVFGTVLLIVTARWGASWTISMGWLLIRPEESLHARASRRQLRRPPGSPARTARAGAVAPPPRERATGPGRDRASPRHHRARPPAHPPIRGRESRG